MEARVPFLCSHETLNLQEIPENAGVDSLAAGSWVSWVARRETTREKVVAMGWFTGKDVLLKDEFLLVHFEMLF